MRGIKKLTAEQLGWLLHEFHKTDYRDWEEPEHWVESVLVRCTERDTQQEAIDLVARKIKGE